MVYRILAYLMFSFLVVSLVLSFAGVEEVYLGDGFRNWLFSISTTFEKWSFNIPKVPDIPYLQDSGEISRNYIRNRLVTVPVINTGTTVLDQLKNVLNVIIFFFNFLITLINVLIVVLNVVISVIQYVLTMVWCVKDLPSYLANGSWARWSGETTIWWWKSIG